MIHQKHVDFYINQFKTGQIKFNQERKDLIEYLERDVLSRDDVYFDDEMIDKCIAYGEKWFFPMQPFQKFLIAFVFFFFKKNDRRVYRKFLWMFGRGGGKNGLLSVVLNFLQTEVHGIMDYNISIVANSEEQAKTSFEEIYNTIKRNKTLQKAFEYGKSVITSKKTGSKLKYRTSNGETKDGLRDGAVAFDEIHRYESNKDVKVHISGLGKKPNSREFYSGTDGYVREGFLDSMKEKAKRVLNGSVRFNALFPFICKLDSEDQVNDPENWELANPMFHKPLSNYAEELYETIMEEYEDLEDDPSNREEFMTKRMNLPVTDLERSVASREEILATNRPFPTNLIGKQAIGGLDYASLRDFAACGLLFRDGDDYVFKTHSFVRKQFVDIYYGYSRKASEATKEKFAPIREWEEKGLLTVIDGPTIDPKTVVGWFVEQREKYGITKVVADNFRMDLLRPLFLKEGFEIEVIRNPTAADNLLAPRIEDAFANNHIIFGDNPLMRWYTNNVLVKTNGDGNKSYKKKEEVRRKTDGFKAFEYCLWSVDEIVNYNYEDAFDILDEIEF
ncbi:terminase TerL endonuclease subunit [Enterococcus faecalis]|uniref:terminase TerL endonuclease subunit n=1 Tax=Enterococcus faecalis TaxID=1351 RepID=UPI00032F3D99|nr:terminase TerL endonuclease subunit [Enterococcus faecalis]EGO7927471.1 terminase large subunit [Enterococcus faecalis]EGO8245839.1 terminase large subunit [Enterococcus faecalis]EHP0868077.1 terminase large subunit [Enterococcus faecalis]EIB3113333.1 terminase large subunit [Enterococcus faecalis]EKE3417771.1 terminase large subunit [Enterococcus faecalis]